MSARPIFKSAKCVLGLCVLLLTVASVCASDQPPPHPEFYPAAGVTALSAQIEAQAKYIVAQGDFIESVALARKINAEAVAKELENSAAYVQTYWDRKRIWEEEYRKRHPNHVEQEKHIQEVWQRRVKEQYQDILKGDVTDQLNWLLRELSAAAMATQYLRDGQMEPDSLVNMPLTAREKEQIWLTDGGRGSKFTFCLAEPKFLDTTYWPLAFRGPEFDAARQYFEQSREAALRDLRHSSGSLGFAAGQQLLEATNGLFTTLENAYPRERRVVQADCQEYTDAKHYLQSLLAGVMRMLKTTDKAVITGDLAFEGKTSLDLLRYMYQNGLSFAPCKPGGEGIYGELFIGMRNMYVVLGPQQPQQ